MPTGRKYLGKETFGSIENIPGEPTNSMTGLDVSSDFTCRQFTGNTYFTGVGTIADGDNTVTISTAAVSDDRPIYLTPYKVQNPASVDLISVDSVVDGVSFAIRARSNVNSAHPVGWFVMR